MSNPSCETGQCDIFEFMARHVGLTVIHPGGLAATSRLAETCGIGVGDRVLDLGCGKDDGAKHPSWTSPGAGEARGARQWQPQATQYRWAPEYSECGACVTVGRTLVLIARW